MVTSLKAIIELKMITKLNVHWTQLISGCDWSLDAKMVIEREFYKISKFL